MRKIIAILCFLSGFLEASAQLRPRQIALFTPLYLDSAFAADHTYKLGAGFPRFALPGLEFYMGAQFALDSINRIPGRALKVHVFDTRSRSGNIQTVGASPLMDSIDLIIGAVAGTEYLQLAGLALQKKIPFVSATYPNDGGVKENPYVLIANPKLNTHLLATYNYLLRQLATFQVWYVRRKNPADDRVAEVFTSLNKGVNGNQVVRYRTLQVSDTVSADEILPYLDSTRENVIIAGSLDENFGGRLAQALLVSAKSVGITLLGMPTWESIRELNRPEFRTLPIVYSNSFHNKKDGWSVQFEEEYRKRTYSRPTDMAFKGYELTWYFSGLLNKYGRDLIKHLDDNAFNLLTDYDFRPIIWNKETGLPDYYENKRVYMVRRYMGLSSVVY
jgi:ABC-type branched-subunit amino acid transport system substrate-binding protein